jgi:hypothetical protein
MLHPDTALRFIGPQVGHGVVATRRIPRGTITWVQDRLDRVFTPAQMADIEEPYRSILDTYTFRNTQGDHVFCWDHARFVNHSFHANCLPTVDGFELAVRDIEAGEELTDDYGTLNLTEPFLALPEPGSRRRWVRPDDLLRYHSVWDRKLGEAFRRFADVDQSLASLLPPQVLDHCLALARGEATQESIRSTYCGGTPMRSGRQVASPRRRPRPQRRTAP